MQPSLRPGRPLSSEQLAALDLMEKVREIDL